MTELNTKVIKATKWSTITEIAAKLVTPISTMVLARVLTPEAFGVMVTATMVISFAEIFTDAGFQKYLIQHEFDDEKALYQSTNVAFISNLVMSLLLWIIICIFSSQIADLVGNHGFGLVIAISSICIPLTAFSSIQMAIYKRRFDFKTLFIVRMVGVAIPIVVTIPLAFIFRSYWALISGMIALNLSNAIILTIKSEWKPRLWYSWPLFKEMFSFTAWSMLEAITIWLTSYVDIFIVGRLLNEYYLGLYRTSMTTVGQLTGLITAALTPILFSSLSRLQNNPEEFNSMFFKFQKIVGLLVIPLGVIIYLYQDLITDILLGRQWGEAAFFIGSWALTSALVIVYAHFSSEVYRSKGQPKLSVIVQISHILFLVPVVLVSIRYGFHVLCQARAMVRLELIMANMIIMHCFIKLSPWQMFKNTWPAILAAIAMIISNTIMPDTDNYFIRAAELIATSLVYIAIIMLFSEERGLIFSLKSILKPKQQ